MTSIVIFSLEGVLQSDGGHPVEAACRLYRTLRNGLLYQIGVISTASETPARRFFDQQHMPAPTFLSCELAAEPFEWVYACNRIRREYPYDIDAVFTPDPAIAASLYYEGFRTILFTDPRYSRPEFRPDSPPHQANSWGTFAEDLREERVLAARDDRLT